MANGIITRDALALYRKEVADNINAPAPWDLVRRRIEAGMTVRQCRLFAYNFARLTPGLDGLPLSGAAGEEVAEIMARLERVLHGPPTTYWPSHVRPIADRLKRRLFEWRHENCGRHRLDRQLFAFDSWAIADIFYSDSEERRTVIRNLMASVLEAALGPLPTEAAMSTCLAGCYANDFTAQRRRQEGAGVPALDSLIAVRESDGWRAKETQRLTERLLEEFAGMAPQPIHAAWFRAHYGCVQRILKAIAGRWEDGYAELPLLGDALEEAGCENPAILNHCRLPGPHMRGCWVVEQLTNFAHSTRVKR